MKSFIILFVFPFLFYSCSIFKQGDEYYPNAYEEYYHVSFPYLHNDSNNLELKITTLRDTIFIGEPLEIMVGLINNSRTDSIYYNLFSSSYDIDLQNSNGEDYKTNAQFFAKYAMADNIQTPRDKYGRPFTPLFHSTRVLSPGDSVVLFNNDIFIHYASPFNYHNKFPNETYYLRYALNHMEFDSLYNPVECIIESNEIKVVVASPAGKMKDITDEYIRLVNLINEKDVRETEKIKILFEDFFSKYPDVSYSKLINRFIENRIKYYKSNGRK